MSFYCTESTQARPKHTPDAFHERKTKSEEDAAVDISHNVASDVVNSTPEPKSKPETKAETDVGVLPDMRATHVKGFPHRGLQEATCSGESVVCVDGMAGDVSCAVACAGECCVGQYFSYRPCDGFTGTLCKDADQPPCSGLFACADADIGLVVQGCSENFACSRANIGSVDQGCNAYVACEDVNIGAVNQGCNARYACSNANVPMEVITNCCNTNYACEDATEETLPAECTCPGGYVVCENGFTADGVTCEEECAGECCVDDVFGDACTGFTGTLCKDADQPPCFGRRACFDADIDTVVQGCNGNTACAEANIDTVVQGCNAELACAFANIGSVDQGCNNERNACRNANIGSVVQGCNAYRACYEANIPLEDISYCCNERNDCRRATEETLPDECTAAPRAVPLPPAPEPIAPAGPDPTTEPTPVPIESIIESECPCSSELKSHGKYVKCVDKTLKALDISKSKKKSIKKKATKSDCGKKAKKATLQLIAAPAKEQPNNSSHTLAAVSAWAIVPMFMWWFLQM